MPTDGIDISAFDAATSSTPKKIDISAFDAPSKSTPQQPSQPTTEGEKSTGEEDNVADPLQLLFGGGQKSEPDLSSPLSMMQYLSGNVTLPKEQPVAASLKGFKFSDEQLNTAKKKIEDMMFMVENDPLSNPISKVVTKSYLNSLLGAVSGAETIQKTPEVAQKEGKGAATLNLTAGLIREGFSLASLVSPNLAAFNAAVEGADRVTAGKVIPYIMSPFSTIIQKNNGYIYYNGRIYNLNSAGARGAAEIGDLVINAILFKAGEGATKYTAEQLKSLAEKVKENTTLNSDDVQMLNDVVGEAAKDFQKENNQLVYGSLIKIPKDIPDSKKVELSPLIEEKQKLDKQKEATDEAFHPQIDEQKAVIDNKINEIISQPKTEENAIQERSPEKEVSRPVETGENLTEGSEGVRPVIEGKETPEALTETKPKEEVGSNTLSEVETKKDITLQDEQRKQTNGLSSTEDSQNKEGNTIQRVFSDVINRVHTAVGKIGKSIEDLRFRGEEPEIKRVAKEKGLWVDDPYKSFGEKPHRVGSEANVYLNKDGKTVTKLNSAVKYDTWQDYMDAIDEHNRLFPNEPYTVKGFTELGGDLTAIVEQPVIRGKEAKFSEVKKDMAAKGFEHIPAIENPETKYDFRNDEGVVISDIHGRNVIKDENGNLRYIDTVIRKPKQEQKSESKNPSEIGIAGKKNEKQGFSDNENVSNIDERKQFAIDFVVNDLLPKGADVRTEKMGGIGKRTSAVTESRLDLGMTSAEKNKAIDDIKKGNYETAPAKKLINKLGEFYDADEFPHIKGTGGNTIRDFAATRQEILDAIDEAKIYKENRKIAKQYEPNLTPDARRLLENDNLFTTSDGRKQFLEKLDDEQWVNDNLKSFPKEFTNEDIQSLKETLNDIENGKADFIQEENSAGQSHITIKYREPRTKAETEATASAEPTKQFIHQKGQQEPLRGEGKATRSQKGTVQETRTVGESEQKPLTEQSPKTKLQLAKERLAEAKKKADDAYRTSAIDPFEQKKRQAQADRELFDAYLDVAREYISETANKAFHTLKDFAKELGEDVNDKIEKAWNVATGKQKYDDAVKEFEAVSGKEELPNQPFSSAQKETEILREQLGIEPYERTPETLEQWNSEANQRIANGEMPQILDKMRSGEIPDDVEKVMLNKYINSLNEKVKTDPSDAILKQLKEAIQLNDKQNTEWGRLGRAIQERNDPIQTLGEAYVAKMEANGVDTLTDAQKAEVKAQFDKVNELKDKAEAKVRELEEKVAQLEAEKEVNKQKSKTTKTKKSHADYVAERKEIVGSIKEKLRKARGEMQETVIPYANEWIAISPDVAKLMKSYIDEGIDKLTDLVAKIHADLKEDIPSITERDVRDIIAGKYNERKETKNELQAKLKDIRDEQKLIDKLESLNRGELPKTEREKIKRNQQISDLQKQIKEHDLTKLSEYKKRQLQAAAKLRERIEKGDFEPEKPKSVIESVEAKNRFPKEYNEALDALIEHEDARADFDIALLRDQKSKQGKLDKVLDIGKGIVATGKALKAGIDDSAIFVQNLFALLANKHLAGKAILGHWKDAVSERHYKQWLTQLHNNHELWNLIEKSGLDVTDPKSLRQSGREDVFSYNLLDKDVKIKGKKYNVGKYTLRPFERAFTSLGNRLRVYAFAEMAKKFQAEGKTFENSEKLYKDLANYLNNSTGRGKLHPGLQGADGLMSSVFWSPRLMASTFNLLGFGDVTSRRGFYRDMSPEIRRLAAKDAAHFIGTGVAVLGILALLGWETDMNPISTTFGSVTTPDKKKSYNIFGRFAAPVRTFAQMATGKRSVQGLTESIPANKRFIDLPLHYLRGRTTPLFGSAWTLASGKDYMGQPASLKKEALSNITPLSVGAFIQAAEKEGLKSILSTDVPSVVGINVSYADNFDKKVPTTIKAGEREVELTESQQKEFQDKFDLKSELYLTNLINTPEYNSATDEEKISLRRMVNRAAMNEAENELRIKYPKELKETPQERAARLKENAEEKKLKQKIGIGKRQSTPSESGSEIGEQ